MRYFAWPILVVMVVLVWVWRFTRAQNANALVWTLLVFGVIVAGCLALAAYARKCAALRERAQAAEAAGEWEMALAHWQALVKVSRSDAGAHAAIGRILLRLGARSEAVDALEQAVAVGGNEPETVISLAEAYRALNDEANACRVLEAGLRRVKSLASTRPGNLSLALLIATFLIRLGRAGEARDMLIALRRQFPGVQAIDDLLAAAHP